MKKPEKQVLTFKAFNDMLCNLYGDVMYATEDFINPALYYATYISAEADANNTVNGILAYYDELSLVVTLDEDFIIAMVKLRDKLTMLDEFAIKDGYRLN